MAKSSKVLGTQLKNYVLVKQLGKGTFGTVYQAKKCKDETGEFFAIKSMNRGSSDRNSASDREKAFAFHEMDKHLNIINIYEFFSHPSKPRDYLVMEYCPCGDLNDYVIDNDPPLATKVSFMVDMATGVDFLHQNKIIHRDLKPQNILMARHDGDLICKITDFGVSKIQQSMDGLFSTLVGTRLYVAPEVMMKKYTYSADVFSLGLVYIAVYMRYYTDTPCNYLLPVVKVADKDEFVNRLHVTHPETKSDIILSQFKELPNLGDAVIQMLEEKPSKRPKLGRSSLPNLQKILDEVRRESLCQVAGRHQMENAAPIYFGSLETKDLIKEYEGMGLLPKGSTMEENGSDLMQTVVPANQEDLETKYTTGLEHVENQSSTVVGQSALGTQLELLQAENDELRESNIVLASEVSSLTAELDEVRSSLVDREAAMTRLSADYAELQQELATSNLSSGSLQEETRELRMKIKELEEKLNSTRPAKTKTKWF